jgi:hypothetical protein
LSPLKLISGRNPVTSYMSYQHRIPFWTLRPDIMIMKWICYESLTHNFLIFDLIHVVHWIKTLDISYSFNELYHLPYCQFKFWERCNTDQVITGGESQMSVFKRGTPCKRKILIIEMFPRLRRMIFYTLFSEPSDIQKW